MLYSICGQIHPSRTLAILLLLGSLHMVSCQLGFGGDAELKALKEINLLVLLPFQIPGSQQQPSYTDGPILLPGAELAVEQINQREDLLPGYYMSITVANSACNLNSHTIVNFVEPFFHSGVSFAGILGPACSDAAEVVSAITGESGVSILNFHIVSSPQLSNRKRYGYSFGTVGSSRVYVGLFLQLMKQNDWQSVAIFYEESKIFYATAYSLLVEELPRVFPQGNIIFSSDVSDTYLPLSLISNHHVRVILVLSTSDLTHRMLCLISRVYPQFKFPAYQFVFMEARTFYFHNPVNFTFNNRDYACSVKEITQIMEGFLFSHIKLDLVNTSTDLVSGMTYEEYYEKYQEKVGKSVENGVTTEWANPTYDGVWSLALALNHSIPKLNAIGLNLSDYTYGQRDATNIIRDEVVRLKFQGASGIISFDNETGYTSAMVDLHQPVDNVSLIAGYYSQEDGKLEIVGSPKFVKNRFESEELLVHPALAAVFLLLTAVALVLIITAHVLTLIYRNFKAIRASSYRLGQLAFIGCYILTMSTVSFTVQKAGPTSLVDTTSLCVIQVWFLPLSITLILGTVTAKTWRLYRIFVHLKKPGKLLTDWMLIVIVLALAGVDIVVCIIWTTVFQITTLSRETIRESNEMEVRVECHSDYYFVWFGVLAAYQGLIMLTAFTLALLTKSIHYKSFKTKAVTLLVYFLTVTLLLGIPIYIILQGTNTSGVNAEYAVLSLTLNAVLYLCLGFLFFPPILSLLREKLIHRLPVVKRFSKTTTESYTPSVFVTQN